VGEQELSVTQYKLIMQGTNPNSRCHSLVSSWDGVARPGLRAWGCERGFRGRYVYEARFAPKCTSDTGGCKSGCDYHSGLTLDMTGFVSPQLRSQCMNGNRVRISGMSGCIDHGEQIRLPLLHTGEIKTALVFLVDRPLAQFAPIKS
jgi:hypothetical protein